MLSSFLIICLIIPYGAAELTQAEKDQIVDAHNYYRRRVQPGAADMKLMEWSDCLEQVAEDYLSACPDFRPNSNRTSDAKALACQPSGYVGENLFWTSVTSITNVALPIEYWNSEHQYYDINSKSCSFLCGDYTQVVWANTYKVGCAKVSCSSGIGGTYFLCDYSPGGNYYGQAPYKMGASCSECAQGFNSCNQGLCAEPPAIGMM